MASERNTAEKRAPWSASQICIMAISCLAVGILAGYLLHSPAKSQAATASVPSGTPQQMPSLEQLKQMADSRAEPLLKQLQSNPQNPELLRQIGYIYKAAHQFKQAAYYFDQSLQIDPKNVAIRTEMASCLYYIGDTDSAIRQLEESLRYDPTHAGTLFNLGMIKWKGKSDADGAIATWETLLRLYPNYERKAVVQSLISEAKQQSGATLANVPGVQGK